jgi:hypothetical protein
MTGARFTFRCWSTFLIVLASAIAVPPALAADVLITSASADAALNVVTIRGLNLQSRRTPPIVLLGATLTPLAVTSSSDTHITALLPVGITAGSYRLTVGYGLSESQYDQFDLTLGAAGPQGPQGIQGAQGPAGAPGSPGPIGPQGLQGPQGIQGAMGAQGATGTTGATGPVGPSGHDGAGFTYRGEWNATTQFHVGDVASFGGSTYGATSDSMGQTPGTSSAWALWAAAGAPGAKGDTGAQGPQGATGPKGDIGPAGAVGAAGSQGSAGPAGPIGPQGPQGIVGPQGATGPQGPAGPAGVGGGGSFGAINGNLSSEWIAPDGMEHSLMSAAFSSSGPFVINFTFSATGTGMCSVSATLYLDGLHAYGNSMPMSAPGAARVPITVMRAFNLAPGSHIAEVRVAVNCMDANIQEPSMTVFGQVSPPAP